MPKDQKPPYFPLYVDDFCSDGKVEAMLTEQVGAYILLLCKAWRESPPGSVPDDDCVLSRWARVAPERWAELRTGVLAAFTLGDDGRWHQPRMRREYEKLKSQAASRSSCAKRAANKRWRESECEGNADALLLQCSNMQRASDSDSDSDNEFLWKKFWDSYPQRGRQRSSRPKCRQAWKAKSLDAIADQVMAALAAWKSSAYWRKNDGDSVMGADRWLREEHYLDPPGGVKQAPANRPPPLPKSDDLARLAERHKLARSFVAGLTPEQRSEYLAAVVGTFTPDEQELYATTCPTKSNFLATAIYERFGKEAA